MLETYCYIHRDNYIDIKFKNIEKLKDKRKLYFKMKKTKIPKYTKYLKIPKIKNTIFEHIIYNDIVYNNNINNIFMKNKRKWLNKLYNIT